MTWLDRLLSEGPRPSLAGEDGSELKPAPWDPTLEALCGGLVPQDALALRDERAGILEHQAGLSRAEAERLSGLASGLP